MGGPTAVPLVCGFMYWYCKSTAAGKTLVVVENTTNSNPILSLCSTASNYQSDPMPFNRKLANGIRIKTIGAGQLFFVHSSQGDVR